MKARNVILNGWQLTHGTRPPVFYYESTSLTTQVFLSLRGTLPSILFHACAELANSVYIYQLARPSLLKYFSLDARHSLLYCFNLCAITIPQAFVHACVVPSLPYLFVNVRHLLSSDYLWLRDTHPSIILRACSTLVPPVFVCQCKALPFSNSVG